MKGRVAIGALFLLVMGAVLKVQNDRIGQEKAALAKAKDEVEAARIRKRELEEKAVALARESGALRERLKELSERRTAAMVEPSASPSSVTPSPVFNHRAEIKAFTVNSQAEEIISGMSKSISLSEEETEAIRKIVAKTVESGTEGWMSMEREIREVVGEERYQIYQAQLQGEAVRELAGDYVARFQALKMLLQSHQEQAFRAILESETWVYPDLDEKTLRAMRERNERIRERLKRVLTPDQLNQLMKEQEHELLLETAIQAGFGH